MKVAEKIHLTYCTNIHPGETWEEVDQNLKNYLPIIRRRLACDQPFGVGLRLSAQAAKALEEPENLAPFREFLGQHNLYVFTINGFPYGAFHRTRVKEAVYLPDWMDEARLEYTNRLARILAALLPPEEDLEGSVSTAPGAFKEKVGGQNDVRCMARMMLRHAAYLHQLREETGKTITLALEPEPCCHLETVDETTGFFRDCLFSREGFRTVAEITGLNLGAAEAAVRRHIGVCYDACHMAVEFEEPQGATERLKQAGIKICKFQISSALRLVFQAGDEKLYRLLAPFAESTYLHQVVEKSAHGLRRFKDLPEALAEERRLQQERKGEDLEWRIHFHVPIFWAGSGELGTTRDHLCELLALMKSHPMPAYLEVETYTWDVLPPEHKGMDVTEALTRELSWVRDRILT